MAEHKIQMTIGGRYTASKAFKQGHGDVKELQKGVSECSEVSKHALGQIAGAFGGEVSGSIQTCIGLVEELTKGGLWGILGAAANGAVQLIVYWFKKAKEEAKAFSEYCASGVTSSLDAMTARYQQTAAAAKTAADAGRELLAVASGEIAASAEMKVHELHIATLQRITDDMSAAAVQVVKADEAYAAARIRGEAALTAAQLETSAAESKVVEAQQRRAVAEETLAEVVAKKAEAQRNLESEEGYAKYISAQMLLASAMEQKAAGLELSDLMEQSSREASVYAVEWKKQHGAVLDALTKAEQAEATATAEITAIKAELQRAEYAVGQASVKEESVKSQYAATLADLEQQTKQASVALSKENEACAKKLEQEELALLSAEERLQISEATARIERVCQARLADKAHFLDLYNGLHAEGLTNEEAYNVMQSRLNEILRGRDEIEQYCADLGMEHAEVIEHYNQCMYNGMTQTEAYASTMEKLNEVLQNRTEAEKKAAEKAEAEAAKSEAEKAKRDRPALSTSMSVSIDPSEVGAGVDESEPVTATRMASEALSEQAKKDSQVRENMRADGKGMIEYLKGNMKPEFAKEWIRVMGEKYSYDQLETIYKNALKNQLLSTSKQKEQLKAMKDMVKCLEKQGLK